MSLRIAHFLNFAKDGGAVDSIMAMIPNSRHRHVYVTYEASERRREQFKQADIELVELGNSLDAAVDYMREHADIVHARNCGGPEPGVIIGMQAEKPVVVSIGAPLPAPIDYHMQEGITIVPISHGLTRAWDGMNVDYHVIYSCAPPITSVSYERAKKFFNLDPERPVVGRLGRLTGIKRPQDFLRAIEYIHTERSDVQFLLAGDGDEGEGIRGMAKEVMARNPDMILRLTGFLLDEKKAAAYSAMDIFLYPTSAEAFGSVFAEAMSIGLPIVTYSDPVNLDVVGPGGLFVADNEFTTVPHPFRTLAYATLDLLKNKRELKRLGKRGSHQYWERYLPATNARHYDLLYESIGENNHV